MKKAMVTHVLLKGGALGHILGTRENVIGDYRLAFLYGAGVDWDVLSKNNSGVYTVCKMFFPCASVIAISAEHEMEYDDTGPCHELEGHGGTTPKDSLEVVL